MDRTNYRLGLAGVVVLVAAAIAVLAVHPGADPSALSTAGDGGQTAIPAGERQPAPSFTGLDGWLNSPPLRVDQLRGKVVLVDFWTFSCVNCVRTIPHLQALQARYHDRGLVIVGIHSPEFDFEKSKTNVAAAVKRLGVTWPVAIDSQLATWNAYGNQYWPADYVIDQTGRVAYTHFGEGGYGDTENVLVSLLGTPKVRGSAAPDNQPGTGFTPELYAGSADAKPRGQQLADGEGWADQGKRVDYPDRGSPHDSDRIALSGSWTDHGSYLESGGSGHIRLRFRAQHVYIVAGRSGGTVLTATVGLDGKAVDSTQRGSAVGSTGLRVDRQDLFELLTAVDPGTHLIDVAVPAGFRLYTITFG